MSGASSASPTRVPLSRDMSLLHVYDLPQLYTNPPADKILHTLQLLASAPRSWDCDESEHQGPQIDPEGVTRYLTSIVSSSLHWIHDDSREEIWNQASMRLSERSGRTAMGAISRQFRIPSPLGAFDIGIHEPALTADNLGLKTWAASYLLAKRLHNFDIPKDQPVLELGSGTGLVGLAMAGLGADVILTDLPSIHPNLARNILQNRDQIAQNDGSARSGVLDWTNPTSFLLSPPDLPSEEGANVPIDKKFPVILAADSLYSPEHPRWLVETIDTWLSKDEDAQVIVEFPLRDAYLPEIRSFRELMQGIGLSVQEEGEENGYDDWGSKSPLGDEDDRAIVRCWWSRWRRKPRKTN